MSSFHARKSESTVCQQQLVLISAWIWPSYDPMLQCCIHLQAAPFRIEAGVIPPTQHCRTFSTPLYLIHHLLVKLDTHRRVKLIYELQTHVYCTSRTWLAYTIFASALHCPLSIRPSMFHIHLLPLSLLLAGGSAVAEGHRPKKCILEGSDPAKANTSHGLCIDWGMKGQSQHHPTTPPTFI